MTSFLTFIWRHSVSFLKFRKWSKFYVTGSGVMEIFIYKRYDQKFGHWKNTCLSFVHYLETKQARDTKFDTSISNQ